MNRGPFEPLLDLIDGGRLAVAQTALLGLSLPATDHPTDFHRVAGMLVGLAIGDGRGNTSEGQSPAKRRQTYGEIRDYLPNRHAGYGRVFDLIERARARFWAGL